MTDFTLSDGKRVHLIGDPHLGKKFEVGVPLSRRGEREADQLAQFKAELWWGADIIVIVGDLFDFAYVGYNVVEKASTALRHAAVDRPHVDFIVMAGNHDMPRNVQGYGAFDDLHDRLAGRFNNLLVLNRPAVLDKIAFFPWEWDRRADEQALAVDFAGVEAAIGHWDLSLFNGKDNHLAPVETIPAEVSLYSGHYHVAGVYRVGGRDVTCTGSLQPYTHGEDPKQTRYVTLTRAEAVTRDDLHDMNVRVKLKRGEDLPQLDALSIIPMLDKSVDEGATQADTVTAATFNWNGILKAKLDPLDDRVKNFIYERLPQHGDEEDN